MKSKKLDKKTKKYLIEILEREIRDFTTNAAYLISDVCTYDNNIKINNSKAKEIKKRLKSLFLGKKKKKNLKSIIKEINN